MNAPALVSVASFSIGCVVFGIFIICKVILLSGRYIVNNCLIVMLAGFNIASIIVIHDNTRIGDRFIVVKNFIM